MSVKKKDIERLLTGAGALALTVGVIWLFSIMIIDRDSQQAATKVGQTSRETICTPASPQYCGRIVIVKNTEPDNVQDFIFTHNIPGYASPVMLDDDGATNNPLNNSTSFITPYNGMYSVAETYDSNYITTVACSDPSGGTMFGGTSAVISILNGETVTCTFTNKKISPVILTVLDPIRDDKVTACHNTWTQRADVGGPARRDAVGFSIGNKGYIGTGEASGVLMKDFWEYNPATNTWTQRADVGGLGRMAAVGFSIGGKGYVGKGLTGEGSYDHDFWEYNPATNVWIQKNNYEGYIGNMFDAALFTISGKGYAATGFPYTDYVREYNPMTDTWTQKANFGGIERDAAVGFSVGTKGYVTGGEHYGLSEPFEDLWEYDPLTDTWTQKADFGGGHRASSSSFSIGTKGYVGLGFLDDFHSTGEGLGAQNDFWEYNPATNTWTQKANFGGGHRANAVGFSIGTKGFMGTGYNSDDGSFKKDFWEYCP